MLQIIGGQYKKRKLIAPKTDLTRPSKSILRETLFNILQPYIEGAVFLDLFAGSGAVGFEALSRGAEKVIFVENQKLALDALIKNIKLLQVEDQVLVLEKDVYKALPKVPAICDIIFADPPYDANTEKPQFYRIFDILEKHSILKEGGRLFIETRKNQKPFPDLLQTLTFQKQRKIGNSQILEYHASFQ